MGTKLDVRKNRLPTKFDPNVAAKRDAQADAVIEYAKRVKDWPLLEQAVEKKIQDQTEFVAWWRRHVSPGESIGRKGHKSSVGPRSIPLARAEHSSGITHQQVSKWRARLKEPEKYAQLLYGVAYHKAMAEIADHVRGTFGTGENEWYTPAEYLELARKVMGAIDLDPASSDFGQETVQALEYFTPVQNGLQRDWHGRVWLNPPYSQPDIGYFVSKLISEFGAGHVTTAILLTHNYTDTGWFHEAAGVSSAICFTRGRVKFHDEKGTVAAPTQGQAFFYFGEDIAAFVAHFQAVGFVVLPYRGKGG